MISFMQPRLIVEQKITLLVNRYDVFNANPDGTKGDLVAFAEQKRLAFKEKVSFFANPSKEHVVFTFRAEKVMDVHGKYFVETPQGELIGQFQKQFGASLLNSTWNMLSTNDEVQLTIKESNMVLAVARRYVGWIPFVGDLLELATNFIKYHFSFQAAGGNEVGMYRKTTLFRDHYLLSMTDEAYAAQDWRVFAAMAVALDALQSR